jgi:hypothetical protein
VREVVDDKGGGFAIPVDGFVCGGFEDGPDYVKLVLLHAEFAPRAYVTLEAGTRDLALSLAARRARVESATASADSELRILFDAGDVIAVPPAPKYEAWEWSGPGLVKLVATPGGGEPAIGDATSETGIVHPGDPLPRWLIEAIESFALPAPTGSFEFRRTKNGQSFELRPATNH